MTAFLHTSPTQEKEPKVSLDAIGSCVWWYSRVSLKMECHREGHSVTCGVGV
jgi:hypothetical protein